MAERPIYPFTALVGEPPMRTALLLHAVHPGLGGVLIRGEKGTAKSTAVRALARLLPAVEAVADCPFGCDPADPDAACDSCAERLAGPERPAVAKRPVPVVELPIGATEDRVLGSLDLETAIQSGVRRFEPGLLARANRGILYVDEVNLLGDHLVDILLDAAAMGRNYVEREGVSFSHPASFMLIGTMNPEEGELRPQLLDRFALAVEVEGLRDPRDRAEAVRRRIAFESNPHSFAEAWAAAEEQERERLARARAALPAVSLSEPMLDLIARICTEFQVDGLRADLAIYRAAVALAAYAGRDSVEPRDVRTAAELALPHRRRRQPFEETGLDTDRLDELLGESANGREQKTSDPQGRDGSRQGLGTEPARSATPERRDGSAGAKSSPTRESRSEPGRPLHLPLPALSRRPRESERSGRRRAAGRNRQGAPSSAARPMDERFELSLAATLRAAAPFQPARRAIGSGPAVRILPDDLRERTRRGRAFALVVFAVDASGSMGARDRMAATKAAIMGYLLDAYRRRDRVALVTFRGDGAETILPPTNSVEIAERRLRSLPTGGRTPLAAGLERARTLTERALRGPRPGSPLLILVSDGRANAAGPDADPWRATIEEAARIRRHSWPVVVLDTEKGRAGAGLGRALAGALGGQHYPLDSLMAADRSLAAPRAGMWPAGRAVRIRGGNA